MEVGYGTIGTSTEQDFDDTSQKSNAKLGSENDGQAKKQYPYAVFFILSNEFCERFSYYGMRAILVLYLTRWLQFEENQATSIFHSFSMVCYLMPLAGAVIADGYLGRYMTILTLSIVYLVGSTVLSLTAVPPPEWYGAAVGLLLIAVGTGGIKASVAPFGADQFGPGMEKWQNSFFSAFYFMINLGSMLSILITPVLRADVTCFGGDCYILAFGLPALLMLISVVLFFVGRNKYKKVPPSGNIIGKTFKCIWYGVKGKVCKSKYEEPRSHWLYYADDKYCATFIEDVRRLLKVLTMFLPLPIFWALSDQQGSRWTLQAEHMDGDMGVFGTLKPDQVQALNPVMILFLIPLFDKVIYPLLDKCKIPNRPLQRMVVGLFISSAAFVCAGLVQMKIDNAEEPALVNGQTGVTFLNSVGCPVTINSKVYKGSIPGLQRSDLLQWDPGQYTLQATASCKSGKIHTPNLNLTFQEDQAYRLIVYKNLNGKLNIQQFIDQRVKPKHGNAALSVFNTADLTSGQLMLVSGIHTQPVTENVGALLNITKYKATEFRELPPARYSLYTPNEGQSGWFDHQLRVNLGTGGVYTAILTGTNEKLTVKVFEDLPMNSVSVAWMIPQYVLITLGEVLFSISGLSFAYTQAPESLKSVVQAVWLLTVSFGDLVVIIVANIEAIPSQRDEFFLFATLMFLDTVIFMIMAAFYHYKPNSLYEQLTDDSPEEEFPVKTVDCESEIFPLSSVKKSD